MKPIHGLLAIYLGAAVLGLILWSPIFKGGEAEPAFDQSSPREMGTARGVVFDDRNENGLRDDGEPGIAGVGVSDQRSVVVTDRDGRWMLPEHDEAIYFVIKPEGYRTPLSAENLPQFYYIHRDLEPLSLEGPVVPRTGPLPESIDFPLVRQDEPNRFDAVIMGDPQPRDIQEVNYLAHDVLEELVGTTSAFAVSLGDISFDNKELYPAINGANGTVGIPFYNTLGNHDANYDGMDTHQHYETWRTIFGPRYYSFDYGPVHFMILADVLFPEQGTSYITGLGQRQLDWIESDLSHVPDRQAGRFGHAHPPHPCGEDSRLRAPVRTTPGSPPYPLLQRPLPRRVSRIPHGGTRLDGGNPSPPHQRRRHLRPLVGRSQGRDRYPTRHEFRRDPQRVFHRHLHREPVLDPVQGRPPASRPPDADSGSR